MSTYKYFTLCISMSLFILSCKKDTGSFPAASALNVINASEVAPALTVNFTFSPVPFSQWLGPNQSPFTYGSSLEFGNLSGNLPLELIASTDTVHPFYKNTVNFPAGSTHSLYLIGNGSQPETMLLQDQIPSYQDSTSGVRFINLSPDSQPITVNLQGDLPSQTEFPALAYKQISSFKAYSAKSTNSSGYTFEIRDAISGSLLTTFTWNFKIFFCNTLVIDGLENNTSGNFPLSVFQVNHY
jgi:hypothetical protein